MIFNKGDLIRRKSGDLETHGFSSYARKAGFDLSKPLIVRSCTPHCVTVWQEGVKYAESYTPDYFELVNKLTLADYLDD